MQKLISKKLRGAAVITHGTGLTPRKEIFSFLGFTNPVHNYFKQLENLPDEEVNSEGNIAESISKEHNEYPQEFNVPTTTLSAKDIGWKDICEEVIREENQSTVVLTTNSCMPFCVEVRNYDVVPDEIELGVHL